LASFSQKILNLYKEKDEKKLAKDTASSIFLIKYSKGKDV